MDQIAKYNDKKIGELRQQLSNQGEPISMLKAKVTCLELSTNYETIDLMLQYLILNKLLI